MKIPFRYIPIRYTSTTGLLRILWFNNHLIIIIVIGLMLVMKFSEAAFGFRYSLKRLYTWIKLALSFLDDSLDVKLDNL